ncbi:RraA family protein [Streptomyces sp. ISID311]|uniref:RraA family protein n=1 Tax=Streptomyces sp. ISID311 TaxID=2601673 RepID=UPI0011BD39C9|nr:RraA family protein [Streptomyces sp. ISID311]TXC96218.1 RraA family protein [Streptomyces sp. ISID311]
MTRTQAERTDIISRFMKVDTSNVADVLDEIGLNDQGLHPDLAPLSGERLAGWAFTIAGSMTPYEGTGDPAKMEACAKVGPGEITVWAGNGEGVCYFGELIALGMAERGAVGALVDGGVRDLKWLRQHDFPVFGRYRTPVQSIGRWQVTGAQEPVYVRGATSRWVTVRPGDFILADEDGALVVPDAVIDRVLPRAEELTRTEIQIRQAIAEGSSLQECLEKFGHV